MAEISKSTEIDLKYFFLCVNYRARKKTHNLLDFFRKTFVQTLAQVCLTH